jgi:hypothetical protein
MRIMRRRRVRANADFSASPVLFVPIIYRA